MADIKQFPSAIERGEHIAGPARCMHCGTKWEAVAPVGTVELECPACGSMKGIMVHAVMPETFWQCNCGSGFFVISGITKNILCAVCGEAQEGFE